MITPSALKSAATKLRAILASAANDPQLTGIIGAQLQVVTRYQPVFSVDHVPDLTEDEFKGFLLFRNNQHWTGLARKGNSLCSNMPRLRDALAVLLDEGRPLEDRLDTLLPASASPFMPMLGKALVTAILHVAHPNRYGVYNGTSEAGMNAVGVWPKFERGAAFSERYLQINRILTQLAEELQTDLWTLDALWWRVKSGDEAETEPALIAPSPEEDSEQSFGLERHLHEFMFDNWDKLSLGREWNLYEEDGEIVAYEYNTNEIGRIDLLAKHKTERRWLVIELKRQQSSDDTVGQLLRYMGWVQHNLAAADEVVAGLIVARDVDARLRYALSQTRNVKMMRYQVDFHLNEVAGLNVVN
jgi:hypothetical protein